MCKKWIARVCVLGVVLGVASVSMASVQDASIVIDHVLNSPTLSVKYSGAHVALVELLVNGTSVGTKSVDPANSTGRTSFLLDLSNLASGENSVEVRVYDQGGKLLGTSTSDLTGDSDRNSPVFLEHPKMGTTVQGAVKISVGFGKDLHNTYVSFFVDNQFKSMTNNPPYEFVWDTTEASNGWHKVEAWVVDDSSTTYKTRQIKVFVNNPGGNTTREFLQPSAAALAPAPANPTLAALKVPTPRVKLMTSSAVPSLAVRGASLGIKPEVLAASEAAIRATATLAPTAATKILPSVFALGTIGSPMKVSVGSDIGLKNAEAGEAISTGPRMLLPTGTRVVALKGATSKVISAPHQSPVKLDGPIGKRFPRVHVPIGNPGKLEHLPKIEAPALIARVKPKTPTAPVIKQVAVRKVATVKRPAMVAIAHGTKIPNIGTFSILLNATPVKFDSVKPRVQDNIPLTPFRYLFEQSGGTVDWHSASKEVTASGAGKDIYIKIGDKLAKVNNLPVQLDLTPFIDHGRTIVPLSFIQDALDVVVDYDPVTNHVLITSIKKKQ